MARSTTLISMALLLSLALPLGCGDGATVTCTEELACANQEGLIATCCEDEPQITVFPAACDDDAYDTPEACAASGATWWAEQHVPTTRCWYEAPDAVIFECEPIEDEATAGGYCADAVAALEAHCSD